jgi:hypothetical protein
MQMVVKALPGLPQQTMRKKTVHFCEVLKRKKRASRSKTKEKDVNAIASPLKKKNLTRKRQQKTLINDGEVNEARALRRFTVLLFARLQWKQTTQEQ